MAAAAIFKLLADPVRFRLLRALAQDRFNVTELTGILGLAQSGVSRHLGLLKEAGLVVEESDGAYSFYRLAPAMHDHAQGTLWPLLEAQFKSASAATVLKAGEARVAEVLRFRRR